MTNLTDAQLDEWESRSKDNLEMCQRFGLKEVAELSSRILILIAALREVRLPKKVKFENPISPNDIIECEEYDPNNYDK